MIIYCVGDVSGKRTAFLAEGKQEGKLCLDNVEVIGALSGERGTIFGIGQHPFGNMKVWEYIRYQSRRSDREGKRLAKVFGLKMRFNAYLKQLTPPQLRVVDLLANYDIGVKQLYINLDGLFPSGKAVRQLNSVLSALRKYFDVFVAVSDNRFIPKNARVRRYLGDKFCEISLAKYRTDKAKKRDFVKAGGKNDDNALKRATIARQRFD